jgi:hypothetical protein
MVDLHIAVVDGDDPKTWSVFGKKFEEILNDALAAVEPIGVPERIRNKYQISIKALFATPDELLSGGFQSKIVGFLVDGDAKKNSRADLDRKRDLLKDMYQLQKSGDDILFEKFGYRIWFITSDGLSEEFARFNEDVREALESRIGNSAIVRFPIVKLEESLPLELSAYLSDAYFSMEKGA